MAYSDHAYQPYIPEPIRRRVNYGWISEAWDIYRRGFAPWLVLYLVFGTPIVLTGVSIAVSMREPDADSGSGASGAMSSGATSYASDIASDVGISGLLLCLFFVAFIVVCSSSGIALRQVQGETVRPAEIFRGMDRWIAMLVACLILFPALSASTLVLGIGLFVGAGMMLPAFALIASGEGPWKALSRSVAAMKSDWLGAGLFCFLFLLVSLIGTAITGGLGALVFVPMTYIVSALAHRDFIVAAQAHEVSLDQLTAEGNGVWPPAPTSMTAQTDQDRADQGH